MPIKKAKPNPAAMVGTKAASRAAKASSLKRVKGLTAKQQMQVFRGTREVRRNLMGRPTFVRG